jgi:cytochrome c oxidase subunit 4
MMRTSIVRATRAAAVPKTAPVTSQLQQFRQAHAISNPTLANIESRWEE